MSISSRSSNSLSGLSHSHYKRTFTELGIIGHGGFGVVTECRHKIDGLCYAVKKIPLDKEAQVERITREVKIMAKLHHQHLVRYFHSWWESRLHGRGSSLLEEDTVPESTDGDRTVSSTDSGVDGGAYTESDSPERLSTTSSDLAGGCLYIQMELCQRSLDKLLGEGPLDRGLAIKIFSEVLLGVAYLHSKGVVHRDLAPGNIFLDELNHVKIGDFGLARSIDTHGDGEVCSSDDGLYWYKAPERKIGGTFNFMVDVYSLGVVLFEILSGFTTGMERTEGMDDLKKGVFPASWNEPSMAHYRSVISRMIRSEAQERPTLGEVEDLVDAFDAR